LTTYYQGATATDTTYGDFVSTIIDVKGDTQYEFTVPYLFPTPWRLTNDLITTDVEVVRYPLFVLDAITEIIGPSISEDPAISVVIFRSAGEDFQWHQVCTPLLTSAGEVIDGESVVATEFSIPFQPVLKGTSFSSEFGYVRPEVITHVHQLLKRYETTSVTTGNLVINPIQPNVQNDFMSYFSRVYRFYRGGVRIKMYITTTQSLFVSVTNDPTSTGSPDFLNGGAVYPIQQNPLMEFEIPWYANVPFTGSYNDYNIPFLSAASGAGPVLVPTTPGFYPAALSALTGGPSTLQFISAAEDFTFGYLAAPNAWTGFNGLVEKEEKSRDSES